MLRVPPDDGVRAGGGAAVLTVDALEVLRAAGRAGARVGDVAVVGAAAGGGAAAPSAAGAAGTTGTAGGVLAGAGEGVREGSW